MKKKEEKEWLQGSDAKDLSAWVGPGHWQQHLSTWVSQRLTNQYHGCMASRPPAVTLI